jgi:hypothetical protein
MCGEPKWCSELKHDALLAYKSLYSNVYAMQRPDLIFFDL